MSSQTAGESVDVALVRILIDGYSLLHGWPELAPGKARHSAAAREELIRKLTLYRDAIGTPITVFFDGGGAPAGTHKHTSTPEMEVLYSKRGQTADDMIERTTHRMVSYGEVLVVTDDYAERDLVIGLGGMAQSCDQFLFAIGGARGDAKRDLENYNRRERNRYQQPR